MDWKRVKKLNDQDCVLVEFLNERNQPVLYGFSCWLEKKFKPEDIENLIDSKKETGIYWPCMAINTADAMAPKLRENLFQKEPVRILAHGSKLLRNSNIRHKRLTSGFSLEFVNTANYGIE